MIDAVVILQGVTDTFLDGTSPVRVLVIAVFLVLVALAARVPKVPHERRVRYAAAWALSLLFALSLAAQVVAFADADIPQHALATAFAGEEITNTRLTHTHIGKAGLALLMPDDALVRAFDTGSAMRLLAAPGIALAIAVLAAAAFVLLVFSLSRTVRNETGTVRKASLLALVSVAGCIALAKSIDGGILSDGAIVAYAATLSLLIGARKDFVAHVSWGMLACAAVIATLHLSGFYWGEGYALAAALKAGALLLLLLALHHASEQGGSPKTLMLSLGALAVIGAISMQASVERLSYLDREIVAGSSLVRLSDGRVVSGDSYIGMRIRDVIRKENLLYWYQPVVVRSEGCADGQPPYIGSFILAPGYVPEVPEVVRERSAMRFIAEEDRYRAEFSMHPCLPERIQEIRSLLEDADLSEAVIYGLEGRTLEAGSGDNRL